MDDNSPTTPTTSSATPSECAPTSQDQSTSSFCYPRYSKSVTHQIIKKIDKMNDYDKSAEMKSDRAFGDFNNSVIHVRYEQNREEKFILRLDKLIRSFTSSLENGCFVPLVSLKTYPEFYKHLMEYLLYLCNKKQNIIKYKYRVRYLSASLFLRYLKHMYDQNGDALLNDATKMISFTMLYHCINASTNYTSKKKVFTMTYITARAKTYGFNTTTTEDMKDMEDKLLSDVGNIINTPNMYTYLDAMLPLTFLKKTLTLMWFKSNAVLLLDFVYVHFIEVFRCYYEDWSIEMSERSYSVEKYALLIAAAAIYSTYEKFYVKEPGHSLLNELLADLVALSGYPESEILLFYEAILASVDRHEIEIKFLSFLNEN